MREAIAVRREPRIVLEIGCAHRLTEPCPQARVGNRNDNVFAGGGVGRRLPLCRSALQYNLAAYPGTRDAKVAELVDALDLGSSG